MLDGPDCFSIPSLQSYFLQFSLLVELTSRKTMEKGSLNIFTTSRQDGETSRAWVRRAQDLNDEIMLICKSLNPETYGQLHERPMRCGEPWKTCKSHERPISDYSERTKLEEQFPFLQEAVVVAFQTPTKMEHFRIIWKLQVECGTDFQSTKWSRDRNSADCGSQWNAFLLFNHMSMCWIWNTRKLVVGTKRIAKNGSCEQFDRKIITAHPNVAAMSNLCIQCNCFHVQGNLNMRKPYIKFTIKQWDS